VRLDRAYGMSRALSNQRSYLSVACVHQIFGKVAELYYSIPEKCKNVSDRNLKKKSY
jgi:hypothetical protein